MFKSQWAFRVRLLKATLLMTILKIFFLIQTPLEKRHWMLNPSFTIFFCYFSSRFTCTIRETIICRQWCSSNTSFYFWPKFLNWVQVRRIWWQIYMHLCHRSSINALIAFGLWIGALSIIIYCLFILFLSSVFITLFREAKKCSVLVPTLPFIFTSLPSAFLFQKKLILVF